MPKPEVEEFAALLITLVRDEAIGSCDRDLNPSARGVVAVRWRKSMERLSHEKSARDIIPDCVDDAIFYLLHAIDEGILRLSFTASNGKTIDLTKEGDSEMADGLRAMYGRRPTRSNVSTTISRIWIVTRVPKRHKP